MALVENSGLFGSGLHFRLYKRGNVCKSRWGSLWEPRAVYDCNRRCVSAPLYRRCVSASLPISLSRAESRCRESSGGWAGADLPRLGLPLQKSCARPVLVRNLPVIGQLVAASTAAAAPAAGGVVVATVTQLVMTAAVLSYGAYLGEGLLQRDRIEAPAGTRGVWVTQRMPCTRSFL